MLKKRREVFRMIALKCANFSIALAFTLCFASVLLAQPNKLYWSDAGTSLIQRSNLNGSTVEDVLMTDSPVALAFDLENGKMYWSNQVTDDAAGKLYYIVESDRLIQRANLDGTGVETLVAGGLPDPRYIALDVAAGKMYWTDAGNDRIWRANLEGGLRETLVAGQVGVYGIALDLISGKMYWTDNSLGTIQRSNLDGTLVELLIAGLAGPIGIALDLNGGQMYWTEIGNMQIAKANLDGTGLETVVSGLGAPHGIALADITISLRS